MFFLGVYMKRNRLYFFKSECDRKQCEMEREREPTKSFGNGRGLTRLARCAGISEEDESRPWG
jgi:hypothetical protein